MSSPQLLPPPQPTVPRKPAVVSVPPKGQAASRVLLKENQTARQARLAAMDAEKKKKRQQKEADEAIELQLTRAHAEQFYSQAGESSGSAGGNRSKTTDPNESMSRQDDIMSLVIPNININ